MKHILIAILCTFTVMQASAGEGQWSLTNEISKKGVTPNGVQMILDDWEHQDLFSFERTKVTSNLLAGLPIDVISVLEVTTRYYEWIGDSSCLPDDPRLKMTLTDYGICYESDQGICFQMVHGLFAGDPCDPAFPLPMMKRSRTATISR